MRIVAGQHRGRRLVVPPDDEIRPTADRVRESLFNVLEHGGFGKGGLSPLPGATVLDAFCGTGALGFEALSRGAAFVTMLDVSRKALDCVARTADALGESARVASVRRDASAPGTAPRTHSLVFLDPPYGSGLAVPALTALREKGWIGEDAIVVVETGAKEILEPQEGFDSLEERRYGAARITILRHRGA